MAKANGLKIVNSNLKSGGGTEIYKSKLAELTAVLKVLPPCREKDILDRHIDTMDAKYIATTCGSWKLDPDKNP